MKGPRHPPPVDRADRLGGVLGTGIDDGPCGQDRHDGRSNGEGGPTVASLSQAIAGAADLAGVGHGPGCDGLVRELVHDVPEGHVSLPSAAWWVTPCVR
jgi:hypothetical protein